MEDSWEYCLLISVVESRMTEPYKIIKRLADISHIMHTYSLPSLSDLQLPLNITIKLLQQDQRILFVTLA